MSSRKPRASHIYHKSHGKLSSIVLLTVLLTAVVCSKSGHYPINGEECGPNCSIPDDHIDPGRSGLFMARSVLREVRDGDRTCQFLNPDTHIDAIATQSVGVTPDASSQPAPWSRCAPAACRPAWRLCQQSPTPDRRNARRAQSYDITTSAVFNLNHIHPFVKTTFQSLFGFLSCCHAGCIT